MRLHEIPADAAGDPVLVADGDDMRIVHRSAVTILHRRVGQRWVRTASGRRQLDAYRALPLSAMGPDLLRRAERHHHPGGLRAGRSSSSIRGAFQRGRSR